MSKYTEIANKPFPFQTNVTLYSQFADILHPQDQAVLPFQQLGQRGLCHVQVLRRDSDITVIATELPISPGKTVTNAAAEIATQVVAAFQLEPEHTSFIEHYTPESYNGSDEAYDQVTFDWQGRQARNPQWRRLQLHEIVELQDIE